jgi:hypothetical protein
MLISNLFWKFDFFHFGRLESGKRKVLNSCPLSMHLIRNDKKLCLATAAVVLLTLVPWAA